MENNNRDSSQMTEAERKQNKSAGIVMQNVNDDSR